MESTVKKAKIEKPSVKGKVAPRRSNRIAARPVTPDDMANLVSSF